MAKQGHGRPKITIPPSPMNHPSLSMQPDKESANREMEGGDSSSRNEKARDKEVLEDETLEAEIEGKSEAHKLWVDVLSENQNPTKRLVIMYVAPTMVNEEVEIEIEEDDIAMEIKFWETTLIMYVLGEDLSINMVKNYMMKAWNFVKLLDMYYHDKGHFLLRFNSHSYMDTVMMKGLYTIRNMPMLLKE
ncbi:unnamed protein product [Lathyrus oleraceus]